jgi:imidazole glycerol-phosphate synthase subunit HisF
MMLPRVIPVLLLKNRQLVKTIRFSDPRYIGDPINVVRIFNEKEVDELVLLDITATREQREPDINFISEIVGEAFMPVTYGGGIRTLDQIKRILRAGTEKVSINSNNIQNPELVQEASAIFGSQSIVGAVDAVWNAHNHYYEVYCAAQGKGWEHEVAAHAEKLAMLGAGEIFLNSVDRDGTMAGYDLDLVNRVSKAVAVPIIACGGAGQPEDFGKVVNSGASAAAAGSYFVFCGSRDAVLITYPDSLELNAVFSNHME